MMIPTRSSEKVTIEDLLRLKRAERPSPEFWTRFEQDLRAKQLAAIVEKRPWWHALRLPQAARAVARLQVPLGSAAVLALSFVVVSHYQGRPVAPLEQASPEASMPAPQIAVVAPALEHSMAMVAVVPATESLPVAVAPHAIAVMSKPAPMEVAINTPASVAQPAELTSMIPWGLGQTQTADDTSAASSPVSTRLIQTGLQVASTSDLGVTSLLGNALSAETQLQTPRTQVAEVRPAVAQVASPRELRRAKILAGLVLADNADGSDYARAIHGRDVASNDLSEDQLYDSAHRLGVGGDRLTLKF